MSEHRVAVEWSRTTDAFDYDSYTRDHAWRFEGGQTLRASAAPDFRGSRECVNPEEALVAALSSCHMLTFLAICAKKRLPVDRYEDRAVGYLEKDDDGTLWMRRVRLRPRVTFAPGTAVDADALERLHASAHRHCFIANSVRTEVIVEPADEPDDAAEPRR